MSAILIRVDRVSGPRSGLSGEGRIEIARGRFKSNRAAARQSRGAQTQRDGNARRGKG